MSAIVRLSPRPRNEYDGMEYAVVLDGREIGMVRRVRVSHGWGPRRILTTFSESWKWETDMTGRSKYATRAKAIAGMILEDSRKREAFAEGGAR